MQKSSQKGLNILKNKFIVERVFLVFSQKLIAGGLIYYLSVVVIKNIHTLKKGVLIRLEFYYFRRQVFSVFKETYQENLSNEHSAHDVTMM